MEKFILIVASAGAPQQYITSAKRGSLTTEITDSALFSSEETAALAVREFRASGAERADEVTLLLGKVAFSVTEIGPAPERTTADGYLLRRANGDYYNGSRKRRPNNFGAAHCKFAENRECATVFPTADAATAWGEACHAALREVAERKGDARSTPMYERLYKEFSFTVEPA